MKHIHCVLYFIMFFPYTLFSMMSQYAEYIELIPLKTLSTNTSFHTNYTHKLSDIVKSIDHAINKQYPPSNPLAELFATVQLTEQDMFTIINITNKYCTHITSDTTSLFDNLYEKNNFFLTAINYFSKFACKNLNNVTWNTLNIIDNPEEQQPTPELNKLPQSIKKYVMLIARSKAAVDYEISLPHSDTIRLFCICPTTHMAATHSADRILRLWDLSKASYITTLPEVDLLHFLCFNADGSQLATITYNGHSNQSRITIWDLQLQKQLHVIEQKHFAYHLDFTQGTPNNILTVFTQKHHDNQEKILTLWSLDEIKPTFLGRTPALRWTGEKLTDMHASYKKYYDGYFHDHDRSTLYITKKNCLDLHPCKQAIENSFRPEILNNIQYSQPYLRLTEYEKQMVDQQVTKKASALIALQKNKRFSL